MSSGVRAVIVLNRKVMMEGSAPGEGATIIMFPQHVMVLAAFIIILVVLDKGGYLRLFNPKRFASY